jgi:M-phase inducer tyrosine phosphatase
MEASSPLAALHRPVPVPGWGSKDIFRSHPHAHYTSAASSASLSLREQLHKSTADYFNAKDVRGSSPAASLAADISQNFRLDSDGRFVHLPTNNVFHVTHSNSPHFPTPRRALFTAGMMGSIDGREYITTPPLPPSSPAQLTEMMEMSPLPHKTPFSMQVEITSPTPGSTPTGEEGMMLDSPAPITRQGSLEPPKAGGIE